MSSRELIRKKHTRISHIPLIIFVLLVAAFFMQRVGVVFALFTAKQVAMSSIYYQHVPVNDPLAISFKYPVPPGINWNDLIETEEGIPVQTQFEWKTNTLLVYPKSGQWDRGAKITVVLRHPVPFYSIQRFGTFNPFTALKYFTFTTAESFTVIYTSSSMQSVDPKSGVEVRFNYRLKDPAQLKQLLSVTPSIPLTIAPVVFPNERENGFVYKVASDKVEYQQYYNITINPGVVSELGETLVAPYYFSFETISDPNKPEVSFGGGSKVPRVFVMNTSRPRAIPIVISHAPSVKLTLYDITPAETLNYLVYTQKTESSWDRTGEYTIGAKRGALRWQQELKSSETNEGLVLPKLPVGVYLLEGVVSDGTRKDTKQTIINVTEIGAVAKVGTNDLLYWVSNNVTGDPLGGVEVRTYKLRDGATIQSIQTTDGNGLIQQPNTGEGDIAVVFAGNDLAFVPLSIPGSSLVNTRTPKNNWDHSLPQPSKADVYKSYIYTDRPIYKPGDTIHAKTILRIDKDGVYSVPTGKSFNMRVYRQSDYWQRKDKYLLDSSILTNEFGTAWATLTLPKDMRPGAYDVKVMNGDSHLATQTVLVSEYRKPSYHIEVTTPDMGTTANQLMKFTVRVTYSFGAVAKERVVKWTLYGDEFHSQEKTDAYAENGQGMYGSNWWISGGSYHDKTLTKGTVTTNSGGEATVEVKVAKGMLNTKGVVTFTATIEDDSVVPENDSVAVSYTPTGYWLARVDADHYKGTAFFTGRLLTPDEKPVKGVDVTMTMDDQEKTVKRTDADGRVTWNISTSPKNDKIKFTWKNVDGKEENQTYDFWYVSDRSEQPEDISIVKRNAATIHLSQTPQYGKTTDFSVGGGGRKHLVVFERSSLIYAFVIGNDEQTTLPVDDRFMPNVFVSSYSFKRGDFVTGFAEMRPQPLTDYRLIRVTVQSEQESYAPGETARLTVKTTDVSGNPIDAEVSLAVVDKAIYDLKKSANLPVHPYFYRRRSDTTKDAESLSGVWTYNWGGGGGGGGGEENVRDVFVDTAFYDPTVVTGEDGIANVAFTLPDNITTWMVNALAVSKASYVGEIDSDFRVIKDVFAIPAFPSFLIQGDFLSFRSHVSNQGKSDVPLRVSFAFDSKAPPKDPTKQLRLSSGGNALLSWDMTIGDSLGSKEVALVATSGENIVADALKLSVSVKKKGLTIETRASGIGAAKHTATLPQGARESGSVSSLVLTGGILGYVSDMLSYQVGFPYGCVEQTMSKFYPTLLVKKYLSYLPLDESKIPKDLTKMIEAGMERIARFQHEDGGWGLWEYDDSSIFNTSYVLSGLYDLSSEYPVPKYMIKDGITYLEKQHKNHTMSSSEQTVALLPLARYGSPVAATIAAELKDFSKLDDQELAQMVIALSNIKDAKVQKVADELIQRAKRVNELQISWRMGTSAEQHPHENLSIALAVQALILTRPDHPYIEQGLNYLNTHKNANVYGSTYTNSQVTKAFVEYAKQKGAPNPNLRVTVRQGGSIVGTYTLTSASEIIGPLPVVFGKEITIEPSGTGTLLWEVKSVHTISGAVKEYETDRYRVSRLYRNITRKGQDIHVGDVVFVDVTVENKTGSDLRDLVIDDPFPAGFEPINTLLDNAPSRTSYTGDGSSKELYVDHVAIFPYSVSANSQFTVTYSARAILPGTFTSNPTTVRLMYEPSMTAYTSTNTINIAE